MAAGAGGAAGEDEDDDSFCSKKSFYFLIPPKQTIAELVTLLILAPLYGFFATFLCHPATAKTAMPLDEDEADMCSILALIVVFFSSYSLLSGAIPEVTPYGTDDSFTLFSHHYQRVIYQIALGIIMLIAEKGSDDGVVSYLFAPGIFWANFVILLLQMFGWLSNPFVTLLYMLEQTEILLFGGTARASDLRIIISFMVNALLIVIFTHTDIATDANLTVVYAVAAYLTSKNYMHTLGLKKPYKVESDDQQKTYANIVFANLESDEKIEEIKKRDA